MTEPTPNPTSPVDRVLQVMNSPITWLKVFACDEPDDEVYEAYQATAEGFEPTGVFIAPPAPLKYPDTNPTT